MGKIMAKSKFVFTLQHPMFGKFLKERGAHHREKIFISLIIKTGYLQRTCKQSLTLLFQQFDFFLMIIIIKSMFQKSNHLMFHPNFHFPHII